MYIKDHLNTSSRRRFLQKIGGLALLPWVNVDLLYASGISVLGQNALKVLSCNIRVDLPEDEKKGHGWKQRRQACIQIVKSQRADIIGFQEVLRSQFLDLKAGLPGYYALGFDGPEMDRHKEGYNGIAKNPIFFSKKRFELLNAGGYWLSETPLMAGSMSWGSARARNVSWVRLLDKRSGKEFRLLNLHLDHVKEEAKLEQVRMIMEESKQYQSDFVQILTGDFNAGPASLVTRLVKEYGWTDSFDVNKTIGKIEGTTHAFQPNDLERAKKANKIDYIFIKGPIKTVSSRIIKDNIKGIYPSDHYFLEGILQF